MNGRLKEKLLREKLLHFSEEATLIAEDAQNPVCVHRDYIAESARELAERLAVVADNLPTERGEWLLFDVCEESRLGRGSGTFAVRVGAIVGAVWGTDGDTGAPRVELRARGAELNLVGVDAVRCMDAIRERMPGLHGALVGVEE